jgi:hypothetical protein
MSFKNPLSDIWLTYEITMDCLRITDRSLNEKSNQLLEPKKGCNNKCFTQKCLSIFVKNY